MPTHKKAVSDGTEHLVVGDAMLAACGAFVSRVQYERKLPACVWCGIIQRARRAAITNVEMGALEVVNLAAQHNATVQHRGSKSGRAQTLKQQIDKAERQQQKIALAQL